jgi:abequosyltransferase
MLMKLSICIATLNRAKFIGTTLDSIVTQVSENVEVVIVDGASDDNTQEVVTEYQARYPFIRYERLPQKGGIDQDYTLAVELARGKYCWLFSDDDVLMPGAMDAVLGYMDSEFDLIVINSEIRSANLSTVLKKSALEVGAKVAYGPDEQEALFRKVASYMSFIGCIVIRKACWDERDKASYFGSWFVHIGVIFQRPLRHDALLLRKPYIAIRYGNATWSSKSFEISLFKWPALIWSFTTFSDSARQSITPREPWASAKKLFICRARGVYGQREYDKYLQDRLQSGTSRILAKAIATIPGVLANTVLLIYFTMFRRFHANAEIQLTDLRASAFHYWNFANNLFVGRSI